MVFLDSASGILTSDVKPKQTSAAGNEHLMDFDEALSRLGED